MAAKSVEEQLSAVAAFRADPTAPAAVDGLRAALGHRNNLVAAKAAAIVQASNQAALCADLAAALNRFYRPSTDPGCVAKTALTEALYTLGHADADTFLPGVRHVQREASWGSQVDAAVDLRGYSALGLARAGYPGLITEMAELLADAAAAARQMAVRALAYGRAEAAAPLLRFKVLSGDREPNVTAECFAALMQLAPKASLPFVGRFVTSLDADLTAAAALAIGESRTAEALEFLLDAWEKAFEAAARRPLLAGIAMTRQAEAVEFLLNRVEFDRPAPAADAVEALAIYKHDTSVREWLATAVERSGHDAVRAAMRKAFG